MDARYTLNTLDTLSTLEALNKNAHALSEKIIAFAATLQKNNKTTLHDRYYLQITDIKEAFSKLSSHLYELNGRQQDLVLEILDHIAANYFNIYDHQNAAIYYEKKVEYYKKIPPNDIILRNLTKTYTNISDCYTHLHNPAQSHFMLYNAIKSHNAISYKTPEEMALYVPDQESPEFLVKFRKFYASATSTQAYINSDFYKMTDVLLQKTYNSTDMISNHIDNLFLNQTQSTQSKQRTDDDWFMAALNYQNTVVELSNTIATNSTVAAQMIEAFLAAIQCLNQIKNIHKLSAENKQKFDTAYVELHTELGNLYFRINQIPDAKNHWRTAIKHNEKKMPSARFFAFSSLTLPPTTISQQRLMAINNNCTQQANGAPSDKRSLIIQELLQTHLLLKSQYRHYIDLYYFLYNIGINYFNAKQYDDAITMFNRSISAVDEQYKHSNNEEVSDNSYRYLIDIYINLFDCYVHQKNTQGILASFDQARFIFHCIKNKTWQEQALYLPAYTISTQNPSEIPEPQILYLSFNHPMQALNFTIALSPQQQLQGTITTEDILKVTNAHTANQFKNNITQYMKNIKKHAQQLSLLPYINTDKTMPIALLLTIYKKNELLLNQINTRAFINYFEADMASDHFMASALFQNSIEALQKVQSAAESDAEMNLMIENMVNHSFDKKERFSTIQPHSVSDVELRQHAHAYWSIAQPNATTTWNQETIRNNIEAVNTAIETIKCIQKLTSQDNWFLMTMHHQLSNLYEANGQYKEAATAKSYPIPTTTVTISQPTWLQPASLSLLPPANYQTNWEPGLFTQAPPPNQQSDSSAQHHEMDLDTANTEMKPH